MSDIPSYGESETGNWNVNREYIQILAEHFHYIKMYKEIAKFGTSTMFDDLNMMFQKNYNDYVITTRLKALERLLYRMKELLTDTIFAIDDKTKYEEYLKDLTFFQEESLPHVKTTFQNGNKVIIGINDKLFNSIYSKIDEIDRNIKTPMNRNDLLFYFKEKFDPKKYKDSIKESFTEGG